MGSNYDFSGWATRNDLKCADGRTIRKDAFKDNDGAKVPLVWNHQHDVSTNVLGHALLENREDGVYAYCTFNDTKSGQNAKLLVQHGDINALSIYANRLKEIGGDVFHGCIREVSLVLAGANPGAMIDSIVLAHGDDDNGEAIIYTDDLLELSHSDEAKKDEDEAKEEPKTASEEQKDEEGEPDKSDESEDDKKNLSHADEGEDKKSETKSIKEEFDSLTEGQKVAVATVIAAIMEEKESEDNSEGGKEEMKHNVFDEADQSKHVLSHADQEAIFKSAKSTGSLKDAVLAHGIDDIEFLFPEAQNVNNEPDFISRPMEWVASVMNGVHKSPFSRIKSIHADITDDDARALGYYGKYGRDSKGNKVKVGEDGQPIEGEYALKKEEVFSLLKRTTTPTTIYKKQKIDRDDVIDITSFDVVAWIKKEMRVMLEEEIARAILVGDGRLASSDDKINEQNIRPIWTDADLYTIKKKITVAPTATEDDKAKAIIKGAVKARKDYKGSGSPVFYTTEDTLTDMLLLEDGIGHRLYNTANDVAAAMRVSSIVTVPVMEGLTRRDNDGDTVALAGIIVNLKDYYLGADKGGAVNMFDDFDIDYNQQKYLMETRCSGAMVKPYGAIAIEIKTGSAG